jgi:cysteine dioxygenase
MHQEPDINTKLEYRSLPLPVKMIIDEINHCSTINNTLLSEIVAKSGLSVKDLAPFHTFDHAPAESYGRRLLYSNDRFKVLLMSWCSGDFTAIHNHGATQWGCVYFMGQATHRIYEKKNGMLTMKNNDGFELGQTANVCGDLIHIMGNSSPKDFMTLHIYGIDDQSQKSEELAEVYAPELNKVFFTSGHAYLNIKSDLVKDEKEIGRVCPDTLADYLRLIHPFYSRISDQNIATTPGNMLKSMG